MNGAFINNIQKLTWLIIIFCIIGLLFMPLLPWTSQKQGDDTNWHVEGDAYIEKEKAKEDKKGVSGDAEKYSKAVIGVGDNAGFVGFSFYLIMIFGIVILIGIAIYKMGKPFYGNILFFVSLFILIFAILIVLNHVFLFGNIDTITQMGEDLWGWCDDNKVAFTFNYVPLIMGLLILIISAIFCLTILPNAAREISASRPRPTYQAGYGPGQQPPMQQQPPPQQQAPPTGCPMCGAPIKGNPKFCPKCGGKLQ